MKNKKTGNKKKCQKLGNRQRHKIQKKMKPNFNINTSNHKNLKTKQLNALKSIRTFDKVILNNGELCKKSIIGSKIVKENLNTVESVQSYAEEALKKEINFDENMLETAAFDTTLDIKENLPKPYIKEFRKVVDSADVLLEVVDARDPLGTRCKEIETIIRNSPGNKHLVLIINKADLVPSDNLKNWLTYFKKSYPVTAFKASTQKQASKLGRRKFKEVKDEKSLQNSVCIGAELLMSMLGKFCRHKGVKTSIRVGVVGIPNVGKSSIINSLARAKSCPIGCKPGVTKSKQLVEIDSNIALIDSPGIYFLNSKDHQSYMCTNVQQVSDIKDVMQVAENILKRASKDYFCKLYDISSYETFDEFFSKKAIKMGKFCCGTPDVEAAARSIVNDWNSGKIKYFTEPPEAEITHISSAIINTDSQAMDFDMEQITAVVEQIHKYEDENQKLTEMSKPVINEDCSDLSNINERKRNHDRSSKSKVDPQSLLEGNQTHNKNIKQQMKKKRKLNERSEQKISKVADVLENFCL